MIYQAAGRSGHGQTIERGLGLHDYHARHYAHPLGRWIAPDTIVSEPGDPQSLNRYGYVLNNPLKYGDPSGHKECEGTECEGIYQDWEQLAQQWYAIEDQGLMDATILAWIQDHQNLTVIQGMMQFLESRYGNWGAILPQTFNTMYAHGFAAGEFDLLTGNSNAQLVAGAIFAGVGIGGSQFGGFKREMAGPPQASSNGGSRTQRVSGSTEIVLSQEGLEHIVLRHWSSSGAHNASKFSKDMTLRVFRDMVYETTANGSVRPNTMGRPGYIYEYDFGYQIGTDMNGNPTTSLRVVVDPNNMVITAFPFK